MKIKKNKVDIFWPLQLIFSRRIVVISLILVQFAFMLYAAFEGTGIATAVVITTAKILFSLYVISTDRASGYKLLWVFIIMSIPLFGILLYFVLAGQSSTRRISKKQIAIDKKANELMLAPLDNSDAFKDTDRTTSYLKHTGHFPTYKNTEIEYFPLGDVAFPAMLRELRAAEKYIFIEYFIIGDGIMWREIFEILKEKASAGITVRVVMDDIGNFRLNPRHLRDEMEAAGIECFIFNPFVPLINSMQNNRDHRKILSIDGKVVFTGGINIADEYINKKKRFGHWKDCAVMVRGHAAWSFTVMFLSMWNGYPGIKPEDMTVYMPDFEEKECSGTVTPYCDSPLDSVLICEQVYLDIINRANKYLYICTPYLIIDDIMSAALTAAARSGVDVRIITPGHADKIMVHATTKTYYRKLIASGIKIYEYSPGFIHSKFMIADDSYASCGTANLDYRSMYLSFECGLYMNGCDEIKKMREDFEQTLNSSRAIDFKDTSDNIFNSLWRKILQLVSPLM